MSGYVPGLIYGLSLNQSTLPTGGGLQVGQTILFNCPNGGFAELMLLLAGAAIAANDAVMISVGTTFTAIPTAAAANTPDGVNDVSSGTIGTGAVVASGNYFLATIRGICKPKVAAGIAQGVSLICTVTAGTLGTWANTSPDARVKLLTASGAGGATLSRLF